jgi:hypothetical protein
MRGAHERIVKEVTAWPGITTEPGRFGATVFMHRRRELGHIHGDNVVDIPCRKEQAEAWIAASRAERYRFAPNFGVSVFLRTEADVTGALELLRERYEGLS